MENTELSINESVFSSSLLTRVFNFDIGFFLRPCFHSMTSLQTSWPRPSIQTLEGAKSHSEELGLSEGCTKWRLIGRYFKRSRIAGKHGYKHDMMKKLKTQEGNSIEGKIHYFTKVRYLFAWESSSNLREFTRAPSSDVFHSFWFSIMNLS